MNILFTIIQIKSKHHFSLLTITSPKTHFPTHMRVSCLDVGLVRFATGDDHQSGHFKLTDSNVFQEYYAYWWSNFANL